MYPNFYYIFRDWFGVEIEFLKIINSFGFFVALSFLAAGYIIQLELKRKYKAGVLGPGFQIKVSKGLPFPKTDYYSAGITGFIMGYKILPLLFDFSITNNNPQQYILSLNGSLFGGLFLSAALLAYTQWQDKKQRLQTPIEDTKTVDPSHFLGELTMAAFIGGLSGAKLFHILENLSDFYADPIGSIVSFSGLTYYGGLIVGGLAVIWVAKKRHIPFLHMLDVAAPAMMLSYGTGRIGCQVSGDGDWGIINEASKPNWMSFLPDWMWHYDYPNNVNGVGVPMENCFDAQYCHHLPQMVYPTPFYETLMALTLFAILWMIRKKLPYAGLLFGIYLVFNGFERYLIEQIRVNSVINVLGFSMHQAEIIAMLMALLGLILIVFAYKRKTPMQLTPQV